jgi:hypothetical protein
MHKAINLKKGWDIFEKDFNTFIRDIVSVNDILNIIASYKDIRLIINYF